MKNKKDKFFDYVDIDTLTRNYSYISGYIDNSKFAETVEKYIKNMYEERRHHFIATLINSGITRVEFLNYCKVKYKLDQITRDLDEQYKKEFEKSILESVWDKKD